jgi:hypothetical protein
MARPDNDKVKRKLDEKLDQALKDSFPGSDPVSFTEPAPVKEEDKKLATVKAADKGETRK